MKITDALIDKLADLSKLRFEAHEKESIREDLQKILDFVDQLKEVDVEGYQPLIHLSEEKNSLRPDLPADALPSEKVLKNAPERKDSFFQVPKVVDK